MCFQFLENVFKNNDFTYKAMFTFFLNWQSKFLEDFESVTEKTIETRINYGILLPKLFSPTVRKNCSSDWEKLLKFEDKGREFTKFLRSLEQFIQTVKGQDNFW